MKKLIPVSMLALAIGLAFPACGSSDDDDPSEEDAGIVTDAGTITDAGTTDAGTTDAGTTDAGTITDAGTTDAGTDIDAGDTDAGTEKVAVGDPCDSSFKDICQDDNVFYCMSGVIKMDDCVGFGKVCYIDASSGIGNCKSAGGESCGQIDSYGICENNVAKYCGLGDVLEQDDCAAQGKVCYEDDRLGAICKDSGEAQTCQSLGLDEVGECDDNTAKYCYGGSPVISDCTAMGMTCKDGYNGIDCYADWEGAPCSDYGLEEDENICIGMNIAYCDEDGKVYWEYACESEDDCSEAEYSGFKYAYCESSYSD